MSPVDTKREHTLVTTNPSPTPPQLTPASVISNHHVSNEAREHAREEIEHINAHDKSPSGDSQHDANVRRGLKAYVPSLFWGGGGGDEIGADGILVDGG